MSRIFLLSLFLINIASSIAQWVQVPSGVSDSLTAITAIDGAFYLAGGSGTFLRSYDGGNGFEQTGGYAVPPECPFNPEAIPYHFKHIFIHDMLTGYGSNLAGCPAQVTYDGGSTWQTPPSNGGSFIVATDDSAAIVFRGTAGISFAY